MQEKLHNAEGDKVEGEAALKEIKLQEELHQEEIKLQEKLHQRR